MLTEARFGGICKATTRGGFTMARRRTYLQEAHDHYEQSLALLATRLPRSLIIKGTTLLALGGASAVTQLLAACAAGASQDSVTREISDEGKYQWSKYPYIEKYNFRNMPWPTAPYIDG